MNLTNFGEMNNFSIRLLTFFFILFSTIAPLLPINKLLFVTMLIIYVFYLTLKNKANTKTLAPVIIILIYAYGFLISLNNNNFDLSLAKQFFLSTSLFLLIYPINEFNIDMSNLVKRAGVIFVIVSFIYIIISLNILEIPYGDTIKGIFDKYGSAVNSERGFGENGFTMVHLGAVPFLYLPACLFWKDFLVGKKKGLIYFIFMIPVMFLSTSRALVLGTGITCVTLFLIKKGSYKKIIFTMLVLSLLGILFYYLFANTQLFSNKEMSNGIKIGHIKSFWEQLTIKKFFLGDGLASYYFTMGRNRYMAHTEVTQIDLIRYFGVVLTLIMSVLLFLPYKKNFVSLDNFTIFSVYFIMSSSNPILLNSFGILVILWYWNQLYSKDLEI